MRDIIFELNKATNSRQQVDQLLQRERNTSYWNDRARQHGPALKATASTSWIRAAVLRRLRRLVTPNSAILELGCGNASSLLAPLSYDHVTYGIDLSFEMLSLARRYHPTIGGLVRADVCCVPFQTGSFDIVYTSRCLINVLSREMQYQALEEAFRVAKPNGTVVLIENFAEAVDAINDLKKRYPAGAAIEDSHNLLMSLQGTVERCTEFGWKVISIHSNPLSSFVAHIILGRFVHASTYDDRVRRPSRVREVVKAALYPGFFLLTCLDDLFGSWLPPFGKDVMLILRKGDKTAGVSRNVRSCA